MGGHQSKEIEKQTKEIERLKGEIAVQERAREIED